MVKLTGPHMSVTALGKWGKVTVYSISQSGRLQGEAHRMFFRKLNATLEKHPKNKKQVLVEWSNNVYQFILDNPDSLDYQSFGEVFS